MSARGVELVPIHGLPEVRAGDDLAALVLAGVRAGGGSFEDGDVVVVTQKVVSKAEGRVVPELPDGKAAWVARESARVVARRGDLLIVQTHHGLVCANAGVDASNVGEGMLSLLPEDPDASAASLRTALETATGRRLAVVITDTFGRAWRQGLVNVAIGCAGLPSVIDLRGSTDAVGRVLEVTVEAVADEVAAASGLVMGKSDGVPVAIVRGLALDGPELPARALIRTPAEDLFRESPAEALRAVGPRAVAPGEPDQALLTAIATALGPVREGPGGLSWQPGALPNEDGSSSQVVVTATPELRRELAEMGLRSPGAPAFVVPASVPGRPALAGAAVLAIGLALRSAGLVFDWHPVGPDLLKPVRRLAGGRTDHDPIGIVAVGPEPPEPW
jgi:coenzyme F420-0:L-glutamate ligase